MERVGLGSNFVLGRIGLVKYIIVDLMSGLICDIFVAVTRLMYDELAKMLGSSGEDRERNSYRSYSGRNFYLHKPCVICRRDSSEFLSKSEGSEFLLKQEIQ